MGTRVKNYYVILIKAFVCLAVEKSLVQFELVCCVTTLSTLFSQFYLVTYAVGT